MPMVDILYLQVNLIGMVILGVIIMNQQNMDDGTGRQRAFIFLNYSTFIVLILDSAMWLINGKRFLFSIELNWIVSSIYYFFNGFVVFVWYVYISLFFNQKRIREPKYLLISGIPVILNTIFILLNYKYNIYFYINESNTYIRSPYFLISVFIVIPYIVIPFVACLKLYQRAENIVEKKDSILIMKIHILPLIGVLVQVLFYGISLIWICSVLSLLFIFINFQNKRISMDPLTQLNNRHQFDICLQNIQRDGVGTESHSIIFIDVDKFKAINDKYGHVFGDKVLISVAGILRKACEKEEVVLGRYGGDEFYVFCKSSIRGKIINGISHYVNEYNRADDFRVALSLSIGSSDFKGNEANRVKDILERADKAMYENKLK